MYYLRKRLEISASHYLNLSYQSKCSELHGHNWIIYVYCRAKDLNEDGMVCDFSKIKQLIQDKIDHTCINNVLPFNPTAENLARWIVDSIPECYRADVQESEGNLAWYEED